MWNLSCLRITPAPTVERRYWKEEAMRGVRILVGLVSCVVLGAGIMAPAVSAKSVGTCPKGATDAWQLVTLESLGLDPETASGIPSLDGNGDGWTCITSLSNHPVEGAFVFRDNTVGP